MKNSKFFAHPFFEVKRCEAANRTKQRELEDGRAQPIQWMMPKLFLSSCCEHLTDWSLAKKDLYFSAFKFVTSEQRLLLEQRKNYRFIGRRRGVWF